MEKTAPRTTVLVEELALGRDFDFRNGRDANGPIFPVGDVDPRLPVHEDIIGVVTASGKPVAFQRSKAFLALKNGEEIAFENVRLRLEPAASRRSARRFRSRQPPGILVRVVPSSIPAPPLWPM